MMERDHHPTLPVVLITWCLSVGSISRALAGEFQVIGPSQPIVAVAGDDVILPCSLKPPLKITDETVVWSRPGMDKYVHVYRDGRNLVEGQNPSYSYRTSLFEGELFKGNVSLKLSRVKLEDEGNYTCGIVLNSLVKVAVIQLIVVSEPKISILRINNTGVVLQCEARSWYPEPQLEWREGLTDSEGRLLSTDDTQTDREHDGRYTVRSSVTVQKTDTNMFICRVQLMKHNLTKEAEIHVAGKVPDYQKGDVFPAQSFPGWAIALIGVGCFLVGVGGVLAVFHFWKKGSIKFAVFPEDGSYGFTPRKETNYN